MLPSLPAQRPSGTWKEAVEAGPSSPPAAPSPAQVFTVVLPAVLPGTTQRTRWLPESETINAPLSQIIPACGVIRAAVPGPSAKPRPPATSVVIVREASVPITFTFPVELARKNTRPSGATATAVG